MSTIDLTDDIKEFLTDLIAKYNWDPIDEIKYYPGSNLGDGYACKHLAVDIMRKNNTIKLFLKYPTGIKLPDGDADMDKFYSNEIYFYTTIYETYRKFLGGKSDFVNVPKFYGSSAKYAVAFENLKDKGYTLFNRRKYMNDQHIKLVLRSFARWHGTSFAFKDQRSGEFEELAKNCGTDAWKGRDNDAVFLKMLTGIVESALAKFDPEKDKDLLERCTVDVLRNSLKEIGCNQDKYAVITKGDCWCNNMMFLYEGDNLENPTDVMQLDWQLIEVASPIYDISYFFYTVASEEALSKLDDYLKFYHSELMEHIKKLGSDPEDLYPFHVLEEEWKKYSKYGFALAFMVLKVMLVNQDEVPKMEEIDFENGAVEMFPKFDNEEEYVRRIKVLAEFLMKNDYI